METKESPITPTVGRIVLVRGTIVISSDPKREIPGVVTRVWGQNCINVRVLRDEVDGGDITLYSLMFDGSDEAPTWTTWRWMPYQLQVTKKIDATIDAVMGETKVGV